LQQITELSTAVKWNYYNHFFYFCFFWCYYIVIWCDKLCFFGIFDV